MKNVKDMLLLYAVTDRQWTGSESLYQQVEKALKGGVTCVQLREKNISKEQFLSEAVQIKQLCKKYNVPFIINDDVEIAVKCGADGVHVGQSDMTAAQVRKIIGKDMILGVSAQTVDQALKAQQEGADYLGVGAVFSTSTKTDAKNVSYDTLKQICQSVDIPVVAIGGINKENISLLKDSGVKGAAVVSAIFSKPDIENECRQLLDLAKSIVL